MNFLNKVKTNASMMMAFAASGSLLVGVGITGLVSAPSYHHIISGHDHSWISEKEAFDWIEDNVESEEKDYYEVSFGHYIAVEDIDAFITSKYESEYDASPYFTSADFTVNADGKLDTVVAYSRTLKTVYELSSGAGEFDLTTAINSWLESESKFGSEFASSHSTQFDTQAEAETHWLDIKESQSDFKSRVEYQGTSGWHTNDDTAKDELAAAHNYDSREEYNFLGMGWNPNQSEARLAAITQEEIKIDYTAGVPAVPNTEDDYKASPEYILDRDAWIVDNTIPEDATDPDNIIPEYVPTEAEFLSSADYTVDLNHWLSVNPDKDAAIAEYWTYNSNIFNTLAEAQTAVAQTVDASELSRTRWTHDGSNFSYDTLAQATTAYRATITLNDRTRWSYNSSGYDYDSEVEAINAYRNTLNATAAVRAYHWHGASGLNVSWSEDKVGVEASIESNMNSKDAIDGETVTVFADYNLQEVFFYEDDNTQMYNSLENLIVVYKSIEWAHLDTLLVQVSKYFLKGTDLLFDSNQAAIEFWKNLVDEVKK